MAEVKPKPVGSDTTSCLFDVIPQNFSQGRMKQVGGGMVAGDFYPLFPVHGGFDCVANRQGAFFQSALVNDEVLSVLEGFFDPKSRRLP